MGEEEGHHWRCKWVWRFGQVVRVMGTCRNRKFETGTVEDHRYGIQAGSICRFDNKCALAITTAGRDFWVTIGGTKPNVQNPRAMDHQQHLIMCTHVPQEYGALERRRHYYPSSAFESRCGAKMGLIESSVSSCSPVAARVFARASSRLCSGCMRDAAIGSNRPARPFYSFACLAADVFGEWGFLVPATYPQP